MNFTFFKFFTFTLLTSSMAGTTLFAESLTISAASSLKFSMDELIKDFKKTSPKESIKVVYGSSGKLQTQITQGAPYDLFFSADMRFPQELFKSGDTESAPKAFAIGRLALWSATLDTSKLTLSNLLNSNISHIAIANPQVAPYGARAEEVLKTEGLYEKVKSKLIFGQDVSQAVQYVLTGNANVGIISLSLALSPEMSKKGSYFVIPANLHAPLEQGFVVTKRAAKNSLAKSFASYIATAKAKSILSRYGFSFPDDPSSNRKGAM